MDLQGRMTTLKCSSEALQNALKAQLITCWTISVIGLKEQVTCCNDGCAVIIAITADAAHDAILPFQPSILQQPLSRVAGPRIQS